LREDIFLSRQVGIADVEDAIDVGDDLASLGDYAGELVPLAGELGQFLL
jgi:hypothetical protein